MFKVMKNNNLLNVFISYGNFPQVFGQVNDWSILELDEIIRVLHMVAWANVFILFYVQDWERRIFKVTKNDNFLSIFVSLWLFAQNFGQVNEWTISKLYEIIKVLHLVTCPIVFILFDNPDSQESVLKVMKNDHFFSIFSHLGSFPQVFGEVKEWLMLELHKIIRVSHEVACPIVFFFFILWVRLAGRSVQSYEKWSFFSAFSCLGLFPQVFG